MITLYVNAALSFIIVFLGIFSFLKNKNDVTRSFLVPSLAIGSWMASGVVMEYQIVNNLNPLITSRISMCFASFLAASFLEFSIRFSMQKNNYFYNLIATVYALSVVSMILSVSGFFMRSITIVNHVAVREFGGLSVLFTLYFIGCFIYGTYILLKTYNNPVSPLQKLRAKYILFGLSFSILFGTLFCLILPLFGHNELFHIGYAGAIITVLCISYAIIRYQLMDIRVVVTKASLFLLIYCCVLFFPFYIGHKTGSWINSTIIAVVLATVGPIFYRLIEKKTEDLFLKEQRHYQKMLLRASNVMITEHSLNRLVKLIVLILKWAVNIRYVVFYFLDNEKQQYEIKAKRESLIIPWPEILKLENPLIKYMSERENCLLYEEIPDDTRDSLGIHYRVIIPVPSLTEKNKPLGFIILGDKMNRKVYSSDDLNIFNVLARQAALAVENCVYIEEFKNAQEKIFIAEKLASIGGMAQGLVHQINNRLTHFFISLEEMRFQIDDLIRSHEDLIKANPHFRAKIDFFNTLSNNLVVNARRIDGIVKGLLGYARIEAKETFFSTFSIREVVSVCTELLTIKYEVQDFPLDMVIEGADEIYGVKAQITETIFNILDNGYEAALERKNSITDTESRKNFKPLVKLTVKQNDKCNLIIVTDNGIGIREEDRNKMFLPFFTTKSSSKSGTGIGMYVVKRIVEENHKGKVWFESQYNIGTTIHVELPKTITFDTPQISDVIKNP